VAADAPTLSAGFCGERIIKRETAFSWIDALSAFAAGFGSQLRILRETALLGGDTLTAFAGYCASLFWIHRRKSSYGFFGHVLHGRLS
jgi:hypothetical protein